MKIKFTLLVAACIMMLGSCAEKKVSLLALEGTTIKASNGSVTEVTDTKVEMHNKGWENGFAVMSEVTDWTSYKALRWTIENKSDYPIALWVRAFEDKDAKPSSLPKKGMLLKKYYVKPYQTREITMELPAPAPHPEVLEEFRLMKNDPYGRLTGYHSTEIDYSHVEKITFFNVRGRKDAEWAISDLELVEGEKFLPEAMKLTKEEFYPFIDKYGQFKHADWPGKVTSDKDLEKARVAEEKDLAANPGPKSFSKFGGWADGPRYEATGHFRVQKIDGKWWMIDPEGYLFWSHGVVRVSHSCAVTPLEGSNLENRNFYFEDLPGKDSEFHQFYYTHDALLKPYYTFRGIDSTYDFSSANLYRKYGEDYLDKFADICHRRLRSWGLNTIANSSDKDICLLDRTPYIDRFEVVSAPIPGTTGWWPVMDPFDPSFNASIEKQLIDRQREVQDPWCLGFFVDNEIKWGHATHLAEMILKSPATQAGKKQFLADMQKKYGNVKALNKAWGTDFASWNAFMENRKEILTNKKNHDDFLTFNRSLVRRYYKNIREAFDKYAPGVLYMGCRFAGSLNVENATIGADYCDVLSFNRYAFALDNITLPEGIDLPLMIGEWHMGAQDRGMFHCSLIEVESQENRGEAYSRYVESGLKNPNIIGVHWHQFSDQATTARFCGENFQVGLTDVCDTPYSETIDGIRNVGYRMYEIRNSAK